MQRKILTSFVLFSCFSFLQASTIELQSPDSHIKLTVTYGQFIRYNISIDGEEIMKDSHASMNLSPLSNIPLSNPKVKKYKTRNETIDSPFYRVPSFDISYNSCIIEHTGNMSIEFRVYNEGVSYRFLTHDTKKSEYYVTDEHCEYNFTHDYISYIPYSTNPKNPMTMAFQSTYDTNKLSIQPQDNLGYLPLTLDCSTDAFPELKLTIMESDVESYPCMFIKPYGTSVNGVFSNYPKSFDYYSWRYQKYVTERESYLSRCKGDRSFPWRVISVSYSDIEMPMNNMVYALASDNRIGDTSWIRPGKVAWDWWNDWGLTNVDFEAGINMPTYKHYIDFASKYGLEYVILDEGWYSPKSGDMLTTIEDIDLPELVRYASTKKVKLILWTVFNVLDKDLDSACKKYSDMGIAGFKVDFLDRNDQESVEMVYRIAECCARYHLLLDLHGIYPPTGINRTYPNVLNFESVFGMEEVKWTEPNSKDMPLYDVTFPFIRLQCGPVDFTPGGMRNATKKDYMPIYNNPMTMGTRCHQMAMYVVHDSPLTMLADTPSAYEQDPTFTSYLSDIPVVYDETRMLSGKLGKYIVKARRKGETWYVAGQTNWDGYELDLPLDFLKPSAHYKATIFLDGKNSHKNGSDYVIKTESVDQSSVLHIKMASGGGFYIKVES